MSPGGTLAGDVAFRLYDTFGFPLDLTQDALKARGIAVDLNGFKSAMEKQKAEARASWAGSGEAQTEAIWFRLRESLGATEFLGYATEGAEARSWRWLRPARRFPRPRRGRRRRRPQPDAVLCRIRRPACRYRARSRTRRRAGARRERAEARRRPLRPFSARSRRGPSPSAMPCGSRSTGRGAP